MNPELLNLLRDVSVVGNSSNFNYVSVYGPHQRWNIPPVNREDFWKKYCGLVAQAHNKQHNSQDDPDNKSVYYATDGFCLAEKPLDVMPVIANFTFRFHANNDDGNWEPYNDNFLVNLAAIYQEVITDNIELETGSSKMELIVVVLESSTHWIETSDTNEQFMCIEVAFQFPYARIDANLQNRIIRAKVIEKLHKTNVMAQLDRQPIGDWEKIISNASVNGPVVMYGSAALLGRPKMEVNHIWHYIEQETLDNKEIPPEVPIAAVFIPRNHSDVNSHMVSDEMFPIVPTEDMANDQNEMNKITEELSYWMPMFLSVNYWGRHLRPKATTDDGLFQKATSNMPHTAAPASQQRMFGSGVRTSADGDDTEVEISERLLPMLNQHRYLRETFWLDIGKCLYVIYVGSENGLLAWIRHTQRALSKTKYPEFMGVDGQMADTCRSLYYTFAKTCLSIKTLAWYAKEDSRDEYSIWHKDWCMRPMEIALSILETDVADALYRMYWLDFVYCPIGSGKWFHFRNDRWFEAKQAIELRKFISKELVKRFELVRTDVSRQISEVDGEQAKGIAEVTMKKIGSLISKLKTVTFKNRLVQEASEKFVNDKFMSYLDVNPVLTGITNGILEATKDRVEFRAAKPEDYVSMCTNNPYHDNYSFFHPLVKELMKWLGQVFTDGDLKHHFLKFAASCLKGRNSDKMFAVFTGDGNNSKSMIVKLFEATLNSYCIKFPVSLLSEKNSNSSGPTPQLARAKSTRIGFMDEPEDDVALHKGVIKRYTGGDSFFARKLHHDGDDVEATFKMVLMCNKVPTIVDPDNAVKKRTKLFPYTSNWVDNPPEDEKEQYRVRKFKININFEQRIPALAPAFLWVMAHYYTRYTQEGLEPPAIVTEITEAYWRDNDIYAQFAGDVIQEVRNEYGERDTGARVSLSEVYNEFKLWFRDAFPNTKVPNRTIVRNDLNARWGRMVGNFWHGLRIISLDGGGDMTSKLGGRSKDTSNINNQNKSTSPKTNVTLKITKPVTPRLIILPKTDIISNNFYTAELYVPQRTFPSQPTANGVDASNVKI